MCFCISPLALSYSFILLNASWFWFKTFYFYFPLDIIIYIFAHGDAGMGFHFKLVGHYSSGRAFGFCYRVRISILSPCISCLFKFSISLCKWWSTDIVGLFLMLQAISILYRAYRLLLFPFLLSYIWLILRAQNLLPRLGAILAVFHMIKVIEIKVLKIWEHLKK